MFTKGKDEIEHYEHIYYVSVESALRVMNLETSFGDDWVRSRVNLPYSMSNFVYTPGTTYEKILEACREHYLQKYPYKEPQVIPDIILGELTGIWFRRSVDDVYPDDVYPDDVYPDDVYPEDRNDEREVDDYLDWTREEPFDDEDYNSGWDRWA